MDYIHAILKKPLHRAVFASNRGLAPAGFAGSIYSSHAFHHPKLQLALQDEYEASWLIENGASFSPMLLISSKKKGAVSWSELSDQLQRAHDISYQLGCRVIVQLDLFTELPVIIYDPAIAANLFYIALKSLISSRNESVAYLLSGISSMQPLQYLLQDDKRWSCYIEFFEKLVPLAKKHYKLYIHMDTLFDAHQIMTAPSEFINRLLLLLQAPSIAAWWGDDVSSTASPFFYELFHSAAALFLSYESVLKRALRQKIAEGATDEVSFVAMMVLKAYHGIQSLSKEDSQKKEPSLIYIALYEQVSIAQATEQKAQESVSFLYQELFTYQQILYKELSLKSPNFRRLSFPEPKRIGMD